MTPTPPAPAPAPDFIIIGAMKSATTTLHDQLDQQPGIFCCEPKEPYFFSNDEVFAKGQAWYQGLFADAAPGDLRGESSTHYTKLPTYPHTLDRLADHAAQHPGLKLIVLLRHPIDRLVSQYIHEWSQGLTKAPIDQAIGELPILTDYSRYAFQLEPFLTHPAFGPDKLLPLFFDAMRAHPQQTLEHACQFLGYPGTPAWQEQDASNVSSQRMRKTWWRRAFVDPPVFGAIRRTLVPQGLRDRVKRSLTMQSRPELSDAARQALTECFDADLARLGGWLGLELTCDNWKSVTRDQFPRWVKPPQTEASPRTTEAAA
ncbi:MAG: sulfotransferase [Planctomycetota bacterium]